MAETEAIAKMAEKISDEIFSVFRWKKVGPVNNNWSCVQNEKHNKKKTHPSDVVFRYEDPYSKKFIYVNFDLKSYAKNSINSTTIKTALESLAMASECTQISSDWQKLYTSDSMPYEIVSSLFVYNHDNSFDKNFENYLIEATKNGVKMSEGNKIFTFSPSKIQYLLTVVNDINSLKGKRLLPIEDKDYTFYYPSLNNKAPRNPMSSSASIEMIFSPWQIIKYRSKENTNEFSILIYYSRKGETQEEFQYLIDYLLHYQLVTDSTDISIRIVNSDKYSISNFQKAVDEFTNKYISGESKEDEIVTKLNQIKCDTVNNTITTFSEVEIGMQYE